jgi:tRNA(Ile2) C34 agmatinyltransferase TiaS
VSEAATVPAVRGVPPIVVILVAMGSMCPKCGGVTRKTSERWARCKACDTRVRRHTEDEMREILAPLREAGSAP